MPEPSAKVIADSITEDGHRLTTVEAVCWRPVLAEQNTHRVLSRNSASSRAIPITKNLERFVEDFMYPAEWGSEQGGMQAGPPLEGADLADAQMLWSRLRLAVGSEIALYIMEHPLVDAENNKIEGALRLHKSLLNRWLEVGLGQTQIITGTSWDGYFWQRCHGAADKNIRLMAEAIQDAVAKSKPTLLQEGEWHLPYFGDSGGFPDDWERVSARGADGAHVEPVADCALCQERLVLAKQVSAGRCARVSNIAQDGRRDIADDLRLYTRLADRSDDPTDPPHASPLEHIATPWPENVQHVTMPNGKVMGPLPRLGNFCGWWQYRHEELAF